MDESRSPVLGRRAFLATAGAASLAGGLGTRGRASADDLHPINLLAVPTDGAKSVLYAQKNGLFRAHGVQVNVTALGSGSAIFAAVIGGSADIGSGSLFPVFAAFARGLPLRIIAPASLYQSDHADSLLLVQKDGPIHSARDLNDKTVGVDAIKDVYSAATQAWVDQNGGDGKSVHPVELKPSESLSALDTGRIASAVVKTPYVTVAAESGKFRVLGKPLDAIAPRFLLSCWVATTDYITKNGPALGGFCAALAQAAHETNAHQAATVDLVASFTGQDPAVVARGVRSIAADPATRADFQAPLDFAVKYGIIEHGFDLDAILAPTVALRGAR